MLAFAAQHTGQVEACVVKPGIITTPSTTPAGNIPQIDVSEVTAAMLDQVISVFEKEPLMNDDLIRLGRQALQEDE